ncbi:MAG: ABC transporter ATP-binding protein [Thermodesulfobacteriota bacterium]
MIGRIGDQALLEVKDVHTYYGESHILQGVNLKVLAGESVTLLGRNGMGKTTLMRTIMGLTPARRGEVLFQGQDVTRRPPYRIARLGIGYVPEDRGIFGALTVCQNLQVPFLNLTRKKAYKWREIEERIYELFPALRERRKRLAGTLSGGEQQMLATARALIAGEKLILMDEPTEGLAPVVVDKLVEVFHRLKAQGQTMLLVEQNFQVAMEVADRCYVLEKGLIRLEEKSAALAARSDLLRQYLGVLDNDQEACRPG